MSKRQAKAEEHLFHGDPAAGIDCIASGIVSLPEVDVERCGS
jgi:hypothetical protein